MWDKSAVLAARLRGANRKDPITPPGDGLASASTPKRLLHHVLQVKGVEAGGVPITATVGRHTDDHTVPFYARTPSRFEAEYGVGALEVDDSTWRSTRYASHLGSNAPSGALGKPKRWCES
jgi:hypothetical protein